MAATTPVTSRRTLLAAGLAVGAAIVAAACGDDDDAARPTPSEPPPPSAEGGAPSSSAAAGGFPLTMQHRFGTTTIPAPPQRVVTAGFNDADFALAVGVVPVGVADFIGSFPEERRAWAQAALAGAEPEKVTNDAGEVLFERVAALRPDLIVYYNYLEDETYQQLAEIAPTVVEPAPGTLWEQHALDVGRALGRPAEAQAAVDSVAARFAREREAHPEFAGTTAAILFGVPANGNHYLLDATDSRVGLFLSLGFEMPAQTGEISREQAELIDQDLIVVVGTEREEVEADPILSGLAAVREGRVAYLGGFDGEFADALGFDSPLSLPAALDIAVPQLAAAVAGG